MIALLFVPRVGWPEWWLHHLARYDVVLVSIYVPVKMYIQYICIYFFLKIVCFTNLSVHPSPIYLLHYTFSFCSCLVLFMRNPIILSSAATFRYLEIYQITHVLHSGRSDNAQDPSKIQCRVYGYIYHILTLLVNQHDHDKVFQHAMVAPQYV